MKYIFLRFPGFLNKAVTLSYDDGTGSDKKFVEIIRRSKLRCTFNINAGMIERAPFCGRLSWDELKDLYDTTIHEVAVHGYNHISLPEADTGIMVDEIIRDRRELEAQFHTVIRGMAYANGDYDDKTVEIAKQCGIVYARVCPSSFDFRIPNDFMRLQPTCHHTDSNLFELCDKFLNDPGNPYYWSQNPRLFYLWGHSFEFDGDNNWDVLEKFTDLMGNRDDIWYATNIEVYDYVQAFKNLVFTVNGDLVHNPSAIDVYLNYHHKDVLVPAGQTVSTR